MRKQPICDPKELALSEEIERGEWRSKSLTAEDKERYRQYAAHTRSLGEKRQTTIRFALNDLATVKAKSKELGVSYQNIIQALVHQYAAGKIKLEI